MKKQWKGVEKMLILSVSFTVLLLALRIVYWQQFSFLFYLWNLFLGVIPLLLSRQLYKFATMSARAVLILLCWMLFLPNAPYIITDIVHFFERPPVPAWYDLLLVTSAAWNGLMIGIVSLLQVEAFLHTQLLVWKVNSIMFISILACAFGIYLGRFLRFNSWDVITNTNELFHTLGYQFLYPQQHITTWAFTALFGVMLWLVYYTIKNLAAFVKT